MSENTLEKLIEDIKKIDCEAVELADMSKYTSFKTGGKAKLLVAPKSMDALIALVKSCKEYDIKPLVLGNGSNMLVSDDGIDGLVIYMNEGFKKIEYCGNGMIKCGAGVNLAQLCKFALEYELTGLEFAYGIPGSVGGAAYMNAGAYGGEMKDVIMFCSHITPDGDKSSLSVDELSFSYRHSAYCDNNCIITGVVIKLEKGNPNAIKYKMDSILDKRKTKQPLEYPSAGSVFKRPEGYYAGALIQECGLKGKSIGGAQVSEKHAGFIINAGGATTNDVISLVELVQKTVKEQTGVELEKEIRVIK